jgi:2'-5' RNA ligase
VLWVGLGPCDPLIQLQQDIEIALLDAGTTADERHFSPHITLARFKESVPAAVERFEKAHLDFTCPSFEVNHFILYSSVLTPRGAIHTKEAVYRCR